MTNEKLQTMASALYYGSTPAIAVDATGQLIDYNLAAETVFGNAMSGRRYAPLLEFLDELSLRVTKGTLLVERAAPSIRVECEFDSPDLGEIRLASIPMVCEDPLSGETLGKIFFWSVDSPLRDNGFHERYRAKLDHQLIWETYAWSYDRVLSLMPYYRERPCAPYVRPCQLN